LAFGKNRGDDFYTFEYEFFRRIANSIVVIIFILIAFPLGIASFGGGKTQVLAFQYFLFFFIGLSRVALGIYL